MKTKRLLTWVAALCCMAATLPDLQAQDGEMRWFKQYCGREGSHSWISSNKIIDAKMDNVGNTYVFGMMGHGARLDDRYICPADSSRHSTDPGYFLAKVDTAGNVPWIRATRIGGSGFSQNAFLGMTVKNGFIYIGQNEDNHQCGGYAWYWFIDTVYLSYMPYLNEMPDSVICDFPFESRFCDYTRILIFDTSGKLLDHHRLDIANGDYEQQTDTYYGSRAKKIGSGLIDVDSKGNLYIFTNINTYDEWKPWNQENPLVFRLFNNDTMLEFSTGLENRYSDHHNQLNAATMIKIDPTWRQVDFTPLVDSVSGWSLRPLYDSVWYEYYQIWEKPFGMPIEFKFRGLAIDDDDNIYLSGNLNAGQGVRTTLSEDSLTTLLDVTPPCYFYLDSVHYMVAESYYMLRELPFVLSLDTNGEVRWVNQLYFPMANPRSDSPAQSSPVQSFSLDSNNIYVRINLDREMDSKQLFFYFDKQHTDTIHTNPDYLNNAFNRYSLNCLVYDKVSGYPIGHHLLDTYVICSRERIPMNIINKTITTGVSKVEPVQFYPNWSGMQAVRYNLETGEKVLSPMTYFDQDNKVQSCNMLQHPLGFQFWYGTIGSYGGEMRPAGTDTVIYMQKDACYMMLYYDSTLDSRRPQRDTSTHDSTAVFKPQTSGTSFFTLTPNPTDGKVIVEVKSEKLKDKSGKATITVCDATGREVMKQKASAPTTLLDLSKLPAGTYFVTVTIGGQTGTRNLVVK